MKVEQLMTRAVKVCREADTLNRAAEIGVGTAQSRKRQRCIRPRQRFCP